MIHCKPSHLELGAAVTNHQPKLEITGSYSQVFFQISQWLVSCYDQHLTSMPDRKRHFDLKPVSLITTAGVIHKQIPEDGYSAAFSDTFFKCCVWMPHAGNFNFQNQCCWSKQQDKQQSSEIVTAHLNMCSLAGCVEWVSNIIAVDPNIKCACSCRIFQCTCAIMQSQNCLEYFERNSHSIKLSGMCFYNVFHV